MADATRRAGGCKCRAVRYEVFGEPAKTGTCHCADCRKFSGTAFLYYGDWPAGAFSVEGNYATYEGRSFCPKCGSRLFHLGPEWVEIELGSLDDAPAGLAPQQEGWIIRREPWMPPIPGATQHRRDPSDDR